MHVSLWSHCIIAPVLVSNIYYTSWCKLHVITLQSRAVKYSLLTQALASRNCTFAALCTPCATRRLCCQSLWRSLFSLRSAAAVLTCSMLSSVAAIMAYDMQPYACFHLACFVWVHSIHTLRTMVCDSCKDCLVMICS
jgi:hypothetical protein